MSEAPTSDVRVDSEALRSLIARIFVALGVSEADALIASNVLSYADAHGIDSHGVQFQMKDVYVPGLRAGTIKARPAVRLVEDHPTTAVIDGDNGLGHPIAFRAMELAITKARSDGVGFVAVRGSTHFGAAGYYAAQAADQDMIGLAMTNAPPRVLPTFGREPMLGTNPIAIAAPGRRRRPVIVDLATSTTSAGRLFIAARSGRAIPATWATDGDGNPTTDPHVAVRHNKLLPLGGTQPNGGHKGYALGVAVDLFAGILSGAGFSATLKRPGVGHFFGAFSLGAFGDVNGFKAMVDEMVDALHATPVIAGADGVLVPGDPEQVAFDERSVNGIPLPAAVFRYLADTARALGIEPPATRADLP
jgi:LDH2 family malate/lactate/ureidoglycolate dehydrogenase